MATTKVKCQCCGNIKNWNEKDPQRNEFYKSRSKINKATGRMSVCKNCIIDLYSEFLEETNNNVRLSLYYICRLFDISYSEKLFTSIIQNDSKQTNALSIFGIYMRQVNSLKQYNGKVFADGDFIEDKDNLQVSVMFDDGFSVTKEMINRWGVGLPLPDYEFLERQLKPFIPRIDVNNTVQVMYVEDICRLRLEADKARKGNRISEYQKLMSTLSSLMNDAKLKPMQEETDAVKLSFGEWIAKIENEEPIPEPSDEFKDVDGIMKYISKWFTNQVGVMLGALKKEEPDINIPNNRSEDNE
jgi:hypothetical protein